MHSVARVEAGGPLGDAAPEAPGLWPSLPWQRDALYTCWGVCAAASRPGPSRVIGAKLLLVSAAQPPFCDPTLSNGQVLVKHFELGSRRVVSVRYCLCSSHHGEPCHYSRLNPPIPCGVSTLSQLPLVLSADPFLGEVTTPGPVLPLPYIDKAARPPRVMAGARGRECCFCT